MYVAVFQSPVLESVCHGTSRLRPLLPVFAGLFKGYIVSAIVTADILRGWEQVRVDFDPTAMRPRYDHSTTYVTAGLLHCDLDK